MPANVIPFPTAHAIPLEEDGSVFSGLYSAVLIEGAIASLLYLGWRLGELALQWAAS